LTLQDFYTVRRDGRRRVWYLFDAMIKPTILLSIFGAALTYAEHPLANADAQLGREAVSAYVSKGESALSELRKLALTDDPRLRARAKEAIGGITGHWGSQVDVIWKRSMQDAIGQNKPILLLHLFGNLNEEFC